MLHVVSFVAISSLWPTYHGRKPRSHECATIIILETFLEHPAAVSFSKSTEFGGSSFSREVNTAIDATTQKSVVAACASASLTASMRKATGTEEEISGSASAKRVPSNQPSRTPDACLFTLSTRWCRQCEGLRISLSGAACTLRLILNMF